MRKGMAGGMTQGSDEAVSGELVREVATQASTLSTEIVDIAGHVDLLSTHIREQADVFESFRTQATRMSERTDHIAAAASKALDVAARARKQVDVSRGSVEGALSDIHSLVEGVTSIGQQLQGLRQALDRVTKVAREIDGIAKQTNLLALNATIEAARAGDAGRGFAVVAGEVKALANQTSAATSEIEDTLNNLASQAQSLIERGAESMRQAEAARLGTSAIGEIIHTVGEAMRGVETEATDISAGAADISTVTQDFVGGVTQLSGRVAESSSSMNDARDRINRLIGVGETLVGLTATSGVETVDTPFVHYAQDAAAKVGALFDAAIASGRLTVAQCFDENYRPIAGTNPQQFMTAYISFTDDAFPAIQEALLAADSRIVFCAAVDRNGFLPTHNKKFSQPQGNDAAWNTAHCRNRRMFNDRVGLSAGRNTRAQLIQTYRRDMGGGTFALMKDASAPIRVQGRHWGGFRIGYRTD